MPEGAALCLNQSSPLPKNVLTFRYFSGKSANHGGVVTIAALAPQTNSQKILIRIRGMGLLRGMS